MEIQLDAGDLVWAKADHYPWWPSIICHEAHTCIEVRQAKKEGRVLVFFFGDNSYKWLDPKKLNHFESNYNVYSNRSSSRLFMKAINEAVYEVIHRAALGMTCPCVFFSSYRPTTVKGLLEVDLAGFESGGVYTVQQIEWFRQEFRPVETLSFVQQLALDPTNVPQDINSSKEVARVLAFRKARYAEVDEPYFLAFGVNLPRPGAPVVASNNQEIASFRESCVAEIPDLKKPKAERQNKNKKRLKDQVHAAKAKSTVKRYRRHDSNTTSSQDHVPQTKRQAKFEVDKKQPVMIKNNVPQVCSKVVFMNKSDAENAYNHAINSRNMFGQTKVSYGLCTQVSTLDLLEAGNAGTDLKQEETPVHDPVTSRGACLCRIQHLSDEIHARYWQQKGETHVKVNQGCVDISEKMLYLLNKCNRIVLESIYDSDMFAYRHSVFQIVQYH